MGEKSKKIGEYGEDYAEKFFNSVGWDSLSKGIELKCSNELHQNKNGNPSRTHGIDFLYTYQSPLVDGQLNNVIISVKDQNYPNNPNTKFREFMKELIAMLECYDCSEEKQKVLKIYRCNSINDVGILFWINNTGKSDTDLIKSVSSVRLEDTRDNTIYLVDNRRATFILEVIAMLECYDCSEEKQKVLKIYRCNSINDVGILFWINNTGKSDTDLIKSVSSVRLEDTRDNTIYLVDNRRATFILEVMKFVKTKNDSQYSFYYPLTGRNLNPQNRSNAGKILPIEYLNSSVIPIKLEKKSNNKEISLFLATIDHFEADEFMRLMGLAKDISTNLVGEVIIAFPDYDQLKHSNVVNELKQGFQDADFTKTVSVINYINPINAL